MWEEGFVTECSRFDTHDERKQTSTPLPRAPQPRTPFYPLSCPCLPPTHKHTRARAKVHGKLGEYEAAIDCYRRSIAVRPAAPAYVAWAMVVARLAVIPQETRSTRKKVWPGPVRLSRWEERRDC